MPKYVSYLRVSTVKQGQDGLGIEAQRNAVAQLVTARSGEILREFVERESGRKNDRPLLAQAIAFAQSEGATLVVAKLDRLARSAALIEQLADAGLSVAFCDFPSLPDGPAATMVLTILGAAARFEAELARSRTKAALDVIKAEIAASGSYTTKEGRVINSLGNPASDMAEARAAGMAKRQKNADAFARQIACKIKVAEKHGATSLPKIAAFLNDLGIETRRGHYWTPMAVKRVKDRIAL